MYLSLRPRATLGVVSKSKAGAAQPSAGCCGAFLETTLKHGKLKICSILLPNMVCQCNASWLAQDPDVFSVAVDHVPLVARDERAPGCAVRTLPRLFAKSTCARGACSNNLSTCPYRQRPVCTPSLPSRLSMLLHHDVFSTSGECYLRNWPSCSKWERGSGLCTCRSHSCRSCASQKQC